MTFKDLNLIAPILQALEKKGYSSPTPIQAQAIPHVLKGKDLLGCAQTGTGKTAAFAIPIIQRIKEIKDADQGKYIKALIVTPTRELAIQIEENIKAYAANLPISHTVIFGGVKQGSQVQRLNKGIDILVATPGRLLDLMDQGHISIAQIKMFVLDEADRMLDMGFIHDIRKLLKHLPENRQSLFFSATMPQNIVKLSNTILKNPTKVEVTPASTTAETVQQQVYFTNKQEKRSLLLHILKERNIDQVLVFSRTKHGADRIARDLRKKDITASAIHGDKAQNQRQKALRQFKEGQLNVLVATDIAARGIDIDKLQYVINYDVPNVPETYVHRIGRSGRAGEEGIALSICEPEENAYIRGIEKLIGQKIEVIDKHPHPQTDKPMTAEEKKEWEKEKNRRKQEFFAQRKAKRQAQAERKANGGGGEKSNNRRKKSRNNKGKQENNPQAKTNNQKPQNNEAKTNNGEAKQKDNNKKRQSNNKKKGNNNRRRSTEMSDKLKSKFMFPLG